MPTVRHPQSFDDVAGQPKAAVTINGETYPIDRDDSPATVDVPTDDAVRVLANAYGLDADALRLTETCEAVKNDGDVCGRELPCRFHSE